MNPSSLKRRQPLEDKLDANGCKEQRSVRHWTMNADSESTFTRLPNEVLLKIFRFLYVDELLVAEQVCLRWKAIVKICFATKTELELYDYIDGSGEGLKGLELMRRYGPALKSLELFRCNVTDDGVDWMNEVGNAFPNLTSIIVYGVVIRSDSLRRLPIGCSRITKIELGNCNAIDADVGNVLKGFPGLKNLELSILELGQFEDCFREMGTNIEQLSLSSVKITKTGASHILSRCRNLKLLKIDHYFDCDAYDFFVFCQESVLRSLSMDGLELSRVVFWSISCLSLLVRLELIECPEVDSEVLIAISLGCPNLTCVKLDGLPLVCDRGVKCFATRCRRLTNFHCYFLKTVSDESLFEIARCCLFLDTLVITASKVTDRGLSCVLTYCRRLKYLFVKLSSGVGDDTVDAAIQAVESRHSKTIDESLQSKSTAIVPTHDANKSSDYLLKLVLEGKRLDRYKGGISHPLLCLELG